MIKFLSKNYKWILFVLLIISIFFIVKSCKKSEITVGDVLKKATKLEKVNDVLKDRIKRLKEKIYGTN